MQETRVISSLASNDLPIGSKSFHHLSRRAAFFLITTMSLALWFVIAVGLLYFA
jgi:hypothetical protein